MAEPTGISLLLPAPLYVLLVDVSDVLLLLFVVLLSPWKVFKEPSCVLSANVNQLNNINKQNSLITYAVSVL